MKKKLAFLLLLLLGIIAYYFTFFLNSVGLPPPLPDLELVYSYPPTLKPGHSQEILVTILQKGSGKPARNLSLVGILKPTRSRSFSPIEIVPEEKKPGQYVFPIAFSERLTEGDIRLSIAPFDSPGHPFSETVIPCDKSPLISALPPSTALFAGTSFTIKIAALDSVKALPLAGVPIRCKIFSPEGINTSNRLVSTMRNGIANFEGYLHRGAVPGTYIFLFTAGTREISFRIPVYPALPFDLHLLSFLGSLIENFFPRNLFFTIFPDFRAIRNYSLDQKLSLPGRGIRISQDGRNIVIGKEWHRSGGLIGLEVWFKDRLFFHHLTAQSPSIPIQIHPKYSLPKSFPVRVLIWEKKDEKLSREELFFPPAKTGAAREIFFKTAESIRGGYGSPGEAEDKNRPQTSELRQALFQEGKSNLIFNQVSFPHSGINEIFQRFSIFFLLLFPLICLAVFQTEGSSNLQPRTFAAGAMVLFLFLIGSCLTSRPMNDLTSASTFLFFGLLVVLFHHWPILHSPFPDGELVVRLAFFQATLWFFGRLFDKIGPDLESGLKVQICFLLSLGSLPLFFGLIFNIPWKEVPGWFYQQTTTLFESYSPPLLSRSLKGALAQVLVLSIACYGVFLFGLRVSGHFTSRKVLEIDPMKSASQLKPTPTPPLHLSFKPVMDPKNFLNQEDLQERFACPPVRAFRQKYILLKNSLPVSGARIDQIHVFVDYKAFLDRFIQRQQFSKPTLTNLLQEGIARAERFSLLDSKSRNQELIFLESCTMPLTREIPFLEERTSENREQRNAIQYLFHKISHAAFLDPTFLQAPFMQEALPENALNLKDWFSIQPSPDLQKGNDSLLLAKNDLFDIFKGGGTIVLSGKGGKVSCSFLLTDETLSLQRGINFPLDFEISKIEVRRPSPIVIEVVM